MLTQSDSVSSSRRIIVVSGIPAGDSGTGRFVAHLQSRLSELAPGRSSVVARPERPALWQIKLWFEAKEYQKAIREVCSYYLLLWKFYLGLVLTFLRFDSDVIVLHPQNLGYHLALKLMESRRRPPLIYLLDSSFFCIASYNHLKGEASSCTRCVDLGLDQVEHNKCQPFPRPDWGAQEYTMRLLKLVQSKRVLVATQSQRQASLAQKHFGMAIAPPVAGLWTQDWDEVFQEGAQNSLKVAETIFEWDVVFHGHCLDAKGATWTAKLAAECPELRFFFPFARPDWFLAPANCEFRPCSWESGLREEMSKSRFTIVPSLWSAPIEGALVKSVACAKAVCVVKNSTSYCDELPSGLVLSLSPNHVEAASSLRLAIANLWEPLPEIKAKWLRDFAGTKQGFVPSLLVAMTVQRR